MEKPKICPVIEVRTLHPGDAGAYQTVRGRALREDPPAFGTIPEEEPDLGETGARLAANDDRCFFGAFQGEEASSWFFVLGSSLYGEARRGQMRDEGEAGRDGKWKMADGKS